ncbi:MAG: carbamate kinase, partial [Lactobacillus sp.]|nr:carbamate kinase [Lactobacillus sp.]
GQFAPGSMLPKVQAAIEFVTASGHGEAIITSLAKVGKLATGLVGTIIRQ